jgi:uroporphyrinogen-III decarboxylase
VGEARRVLGEGRGGAHVFNLGHGVFPTTSPDAVAAWSTPCTPSTAARGPVT